MLKRIDEAWDPYQLLLVFTCGNKAWIDFIQEYNFTEKERQIPILYKADTAMYWRKKIRAEALGQEFEQDPP